ncbi:MAG: hypothetical protein GF417_01705, partial [Candidatus Latescibacteria bacterium]|nr:hypothetical protein [bacterium]MBD3423142.1 hypothetical protein [Candidatus Latescibacterota bacterium]
MRRFLIILVLAAISTPAASSEPVVRILDSDSRGLLVEVTNPGYSIIPAGGSGAENVVIEVSGFTLDRTDGRPILPSRRYLFSVGSTDDIRIDIVDTDTEIINGAKPVLFRSETEPEKLLWNGPGVIPFEEESFVFLRRTGIYRKNPLALVEIRPVIYRKERGRLVYASRLVFRISHRASGEVRGAGLPYFVMGAGSADEIKTDKAGAPRGSYMFGRSTDWIRLEISGPGIYSVSYQDLVDIGINPMEIDPAGIRLFSGGYFSGFENPFQQPASISAGGSFEPGYSMNQHALKLVGMDDGTFGPDDFVLFYGVGVRGWTDYLDPQASGHERYDHIYEDNNVYWMSWGGTFQQDAERMGSLDVSPASTPPPIAVDRYTERLHLEEDREYFPLISDDRWVWD